MWQKITDSSILFNKEYNNNNNFYSNNIFINRLYFYYINKGYYNIITSQLVNILISNFIIWFIIFLFNVINYNKLLTVKDYIYINEILDWSNFFNLNYFMWIMISIYILYTIVKLLNLVDNFIKYYYVKYYFNKNLKIKDKELEFLEWDIIIKKISESYNNNFDICNINSIITLKENYMISLFDKNILVIDHLTYLMEWNIIYCIILKIFSKYNNNIINDKNIFNKKKNLIKEIEFTTRFISIVNFVLMPFLLTIMIFFSVFNYGEEFYNNPNLLGTRIFTKKALWKLRNYNELDHEFNKRINKISKLSLDYTKLFTNNIIKNIFNLFLFISSAFFIVLIILSILNDKILIYVLITKKQSILWLIGILGSLIAFFRTSKNNLHPEDIMKDICEHIFIEKNFVDNSFKQEKFNKFVKLYQYKLVYIIKDIIYTILVPFHLWIISYHITDIVNFINDHTIEHKELKYTCVLSNFSSMIDIPYNTDELSIKKNLNSNIDNDNDNDNDNDSSRYDFKNNTRTQISFNYFKNKYPSWEKNVLMKLYNMNQSVKINVI